MKLNAGLNILMLGARRCGKSSTLAAMVSSLENNSSSIEVSFDNKSTKQKLMQKEKSLRAVFSEQFIEQGWWADPEEDSTSSIESFQFNVKWHKDFEIKVLCWDLPGELIKKDIKQLVPLVSAADVIIIAVDTPQIMENGNQGVIKNYVRDITDLITNVTTDKGDFMKRIIFVPVKCEKYIHSKRMTEVNDRIKVVYDDLIHCWKRVVSGIFIIPVETLGNIEFDHFERQKDISPIAIYKYIGNNSFAPRWCEQPLIYAIEHVFLKIPWEGSKNPTILQKIAKGSVDFLDWGLGL